MVVFWLPVCCSWPQVCFRLLPSGMHRLQPRPAPVISTKMRREGYYSPREAGCTQNVCKLKFPLRVGVAVAVVGAVVAGAIAWFAGSKSNSRHSHSAHSKVIKCKNCYTQAEMNYESWSQPPRILCLVLLTLFPFPPSPHFSPPVELSES